MTVISKGHEGVITRLVPGGALGLAHLSDDELLANTRRLVGKTNQLFAALLAHLAEVEARGVHRTRRCASLYTYCIYELRFSEDAAARRSAAARLVKEFPPLFDAIANGELHEVYQRDAGRCTYVDSRGERCCETRYLELHHLQAFAKHGANVASNLTLRCAAHNALAVEDDFGRQLIIQRRDATRHEALSAQGGSSFR